VKYLHKNSKDFKYKENTGVLPGCALKKTFYNRSSATEMPKIHIAYSYSTGSWA
jgi:hypothetical protein